MRCPHCHVAIASAMEAVALGEDQDGKWSVLKTTCPECKKLILHLNRYEEERGHGAFVAPPGSRDSGIAASADYRPARAETVLIRPRGAARDPAPTQVPATIAGDYV